jgi:hypothetical protein
MVGADPQRILGTFSGFGKSRIVITLDCDVGGATGRVNVSVRPNTDPASIGCDVAARDFPVCEAIVDSPLRGYAALLGWIQLVGTRTALNAPLRFGPDPLQLFADLDLPFCFHGINPTLFDAPYRRNRAQHLDWIAHSFLCTSPDESRPRAIRPIAAFRWGFVLDAGSIELVSPEPLPLGEWAVHQPLMSAAYPSWRF